MIKVSVIIPTYHDWLRLQLCLEALENQSYTKDDFEILVVNNDPGDHIPKDFVIPENCEILDEAKPGSYAARNHAIKVAKGDILAFTDSDCIPDKDWLVNGIATLIKQNVDRVGGAVHVFANKKPNIAEVYDLVFAFPQQDYVEDMGWAVTANLFVTSKLIEDVGYFNYNLKSGGDYDWGQRALKKGYPIFFAKDAVVNHPARDSVQELLQKAKRVREGTEDKHYEEDRLRAYPKLIRRLHIIFRPRLEEFDEIGKKINKLNLDKSYKIKLLLLRNLVVGYKDYCSFKRRKKLMKK